MKKLSKERLEEIERKEVSVSTAHILADLFDHIDYLEAELAKARETADFNLCCTAKIQEELNAERAARAEAEQRLAVSSEAGDVVYRDMCRHAARIDELERENEALRKDAADRASVWTPEGLEKRPVSILVNQITLLEEDLWCVHKWLDEQGVHREEPGGVLSIVGRIQRRDALLAGQGSTVEGKSNSAQTLDAPTKPVAAPQFCPTCNGYGRISEHVQCDDCHGVGGPAPEPVATGRPGDEARAGEKVLTRQELIWTWWKDAWRENRKRDVADMLHTDGALRGELALMRERAEAAEKRVAELAEHLGHQLKMYGELAIAICGAGGSPDKVAAKGLAEIVAERDQLRAQLTTADKAGSERRMVRCETERQYGKCAGCWHCGRSDGRAEVIRWLRDPANATSDRAFYYNSAADLLEKPAREVIDEAGGGAK